jgi:hypothetical protein
MSAPLTSPDQYTCAGGEIRKAEIHVRFDFVRDEGSKMTPHDYVPPSPLFFIHYLANTVRDRLKNFTRSSLQKCLLSNQKRKTNNIKKQGSSVRRVVGMIMRRHNYFHDFAKT